ncbi:hypothetical protein SAMN06265360_107199 [Haloechinothrix alba]|uniref:Cytochrome P450 n=1 Tax=Haloechinothrix alba TaxID=664784 RepID=A0A238WTB4_9PSEU|nr:cytochrome P450 [Haloechinothrix alba]SNR49782.1 hypothetical protein SAMN06265360_107199 [Haloechinothrix alba]
MPEASQSIIAIDPPRHSKLRRLISKAFTPKQMKRIEDRIRANARMIVDDLAPKGEADFVAECAALMPMHNICDMMGIPYADRQKVAHEAAMPTGVSDPDVVGEGDPVQRLFEAAGYVHDMAKRLAAQRRDEPGDDLITALAVSEVDGARLTDDEIVFDRPNEFDLSRDPNPHVGFGGNGIHHCLGNQLARTQLRVLFDELLHRLPDIRAGEPDLLNANFIHGIKRMPCTFTPQR